MRRTRVVLMIALVGCGRFSFDPLATSDGGGDSGVGSSDDAGSGGCGFTA